MKKAHVISDCTKKSRNQIQESKGEILEKYASARMSLDTLENYTDK